MAGSKVFKILTEEGWKKCQESGLIYPRDGEEFVHLSTGEQYLESAKLYYSDFVKVYALEFNLKESDPALKWERSESRDEDFPHYYEPLPADQIECVHLLMKAEDGSFQVMDSSKV